MKSIQILGVNITDITQLQAERSIEVAIQQQKRLFISTPGPEFLVRAAHNPAYRKILNQSDIALPDGIGLIFATFGQIHTRVTGADMTRFLMNYAQINHLKIAFVLRSDGLTMPADLRKTLESQHAGLQYTITTDHNIAELTAFKPQIIIVALGSPAQELWITQHMNRLASTSIFIGVGGSIDYITGKALRAPLFLRKMGLEWFWRLLRQPQRLRRIINATLVFPYLVIKNLFSNHNYEQ